MSTSCLFEHNILALPLQARFFMLLLIHVVETFPKLFSLRQPIHTRAFVMVAKSHQMMLFLKLDYGELAPRSFGLTLFDKNTSTDLL